VKLSSAFRVPRSALEAGPAPARDEVVDYLIGQFARLTKLPADQIYADEPLDSFGVDSIMVSGFAEMLERDLGEISRTLLFEHPTLASLADFLLQNHAPGLARTLHRVTPHTTTAAGPPGLSAGVSLSRFLPVERPQPAGDSDPTKLASGEAAAIAIVGVSGRYPMADDLEEFWVNLRSGRDCITEIPRDRWSLEAYFDPEPGTPGKTNNKWGGFIRDVDAFDALFFGISPREAQFMDPQERIFMETVWKTVEDAGYSRSRLEGRKVGVFVGVMYGQYQLHGVEQRLQGNPISLSSSFATIANRVSYFFNWRGPSMALDTMCSSSLTSIHLACESIRRGECECAIAGGVNTSIHPEKDIILSQSFFTASHGRCKTFGAGGDGYVAGEGVGALLLKPLDQAIRDCDPIHGVIRGSALNHGGRTNGYTVPNSRSQAEVILAALHQANIPASTVSYVEAHGTGTVLGDPIEMTGLQQAFAESMEKEEPAAEKSTIAIGSVKSNIGHCESAAGIAGVTKVLLQFQHATLVPSLHAQPLNPNIRFEETFFRVQQESAPWDRMVREGTVVPRRAGVSSFGAGGANAHVVLEEYPCPDSDGAGVAASGPVLIVLSARTEDRLREMALRFADYLERRPELNRDEPLRRIAFTLQIGREAFEHRLALRVTTTEDCARRLRSWLAGEEVGDLWRGTARRAPARELNATGSPATSESASAGDMADMGELAASWVNGGGVAWERLYTALPRRVRLPTYPFARQRHWFPAKPGVAAGNGGNGSGHKGNGEQGNGGIEIAGERESSALSAGKECRPELSLMFFSDNSHVQAGNKYDLVLQAARFADAHGFAAVWTPERHFHPFGGIYSAPAALSAAIAVVTRRIRVRAGSVVVPLEDPLRVAEAWAVVDNLSGGRVDLAFASGWNPNDFALAPDAYARLRDVWLERIPIIQKLWRGECIERVNGKGERVQLQVYPRPIQGELPVWLTASRRVETFIEAGRAGYHVLTMLQGTTLEQLTGKIRQYREARAAAGFDPATGRVTLMLHTFVHENGEHAAETVREPFVEYIRSSLNAHMTAIEGGSRVSAADLAEMSRYSYERYRRQASLIGSPAECVEMIRKCREAGVDEIACLLDFGAPPGAILEALPHLETLRGMMEGGTREADSSAQCDSGGARAVPARSGPGEAPAARPSPDHGTWPSMNAEGGVPEQREMEGRLLLPGWVAETSEQADVPWDHKPGAPSPAALTGRGVSPATEASANLLRPETGRGPTIPRSALRSRSGVESPAAGAVRSAGGSVWIVHSGSTELAQAIAVAHAGARIAEVRIGSKTCRHDVDHWEVNADDLVDLGRCTADLPRPEAVYFVGAGIEASAESGVIDQVRWAQQRGPVALMTLIQAMDGRGWLAAPLSIKAITAGVQEVHPGEAVLALDSGLQGLMGSLAREFPALEIGCVDLSPEELERRGTIHEMARHIVSECAGGRGEKIALRGGRRYRLQLQLAEFSADSPPAFRDGGVYLVMGGAGRVGFQLSRHLARRYGAKLMWVGRRPRDAQVEAKLARIREEGGEVLYEQASAEDLAGMQRAVEMAECSFGPLNGIIHSTLVYHDQLVRKTPRDEFERVLNSKTISSAVVHELARARSLDFVLFLGSAQSFFNEARRGAYAAGCCFIDAYARYMAGQLDCPVKVINWGFWSHSFGPEIQATMRSAGLGVIEAENGLRALERFAGSAELQALYLVADDEALVRMGVDPSVRVLSLPSGATDAAVDLFTSSLFS
jgi:natural product biosynthesis luciferase-like monooxygenase protein